MLFQACFFANYFNYVHQICHTLLFNLMITSIIMKTVNLLITILREGEDQALIRMSRWWWRILVGGVLVSGVVYPAQAAVTTYPITGIQVVQTRVYQTNS